MTYGKKIDTFISSAVVKWSAEPKGGESWAPIPGERARGTLKHGTVDINNEVLPYK